MTRYRITENGRPLEQCGNSKSSWKVLMNFWFTHGHAGQYFEVDKCMALLDEKGLKLEGIEGPEVKA